MTVVVEKPSRVPAVFGGQHILVTGGSGFMGKVLIEKLLRSCPDISCIYLLLRTKRGVAPEERLKSIIDCALFDKLKEMRPEATEKLVVVPGDCSQLGLGLSPEDADMLAANVSIVFHVAATVRFDDPLRNAILLNTRGTREVVALARRMSKLKVLQHVSTAYCYTNLPELMEEMPKMPETTTISWQTLIRVAETADDATLHAITSKLLDWQPNTYTFSKALAEQVISDVKSELPVMIIRPAVVLPTYKEPLAGWVDNLNGPFSIWWGASKGIIRALYLNPDTSLCFTGVDWAVRCMILSAWATACGWKSSNPNQPRVVNTEFSNTKCILTFAQQKRYFSEFRPLVPNAVRYPRVIITTNLLLWWCVILFNQVPYCILVDTILRLTGNRPRALAVTRKLIIATRAMYPFMFNNYQMKTERIYQLDRYLSKEDRDEFGVAIVDTYDPLVFGKTVLEGLMKYVFKEDGNIEETKRHLVRLRVLEVVEYIILAAFFWWMYQLFSPFEDGIFPATSNKYLLARQVPV